MSSPVAHGLAAYALWITLEPQTVRSQKTHLQAAGAALLFGSLADTDFLVAQFTDVPALQHHYFSHSIAFALCVFAACFVVARVLPRTLNFIFAADARRTAFLLGTAYSTHLLLDYFTSDGSPPFGIPLFWPLTDRHFQAPVEIFESIHRGSLQILFSLHNFKAILFEFLSAAPPALAAYLVANRRSAGGSRVAHPRRA